MLCAHCWEAKGGVCALIAGKRLYSAPRFARIHELPKKSVLLPDTRAGGGILIVSKGTVKLSTISICGKSNAISIIRRGNLARTPKAAGGLTATALQPSVVCQVEDRVIRESLKTSPDLARYLNNKYRDEMRRLRAHLVLLGIRSARQRLAAFLMLSEIDQLDKEAKPEMLSIPFTRYDIAEFLLLTPETVSRAFTELISSGMLVTVTPKRIRMKTSHLGWKEISKEHLTVI